MSFNFFFQLWDLGVSAFQKRAFHIFQSSWIAIELNIGKELENKDRTVQISAYVSQQAKVHGFVSKAGSELFYIYNNI